MSSPAKKWIKFSVRWGIAVGGILWVLLNISFRDRVLLLDRQTLIPYHAHVLGEANDTDSAFRVEHWSNDGGERHWMSRQVNRDDLWTRPDLKYAQVRLENGQPHKLELLAAQPADAQPADGDTDRAAKAIIAKDPATGQVSRVRPDQLAEITPLTISSPLVEVGLIRLVREADPAYLLGAIFILPLNYLLTSFRWNVLLRAVNIRLSQARTFVLNMVGAFYNAFMPGTTGGDLIKAYDVSKQTPLRTAAVMSVIVDRGIGLFALIVIGGAMAAYQWDVPDCRRVAKLSAIIIGGVVTSAIVFYTPILRRMTGMNFLLARLPMQRQVRKAVHALEQYGRRPGLTLGALLMAFPVHFAGIMSASMAGHAFGLKLDNLYYWSVVPVIILVGAIPISPQGAGVMEYFAVELTKRHGVTIGQAFALTMSIRLMQMLWNLTGGIFVLRGGFHTPTDAELHELVEDEPGIAPTPEPAVKAEPTPAKLAVGQA